MNINRNNYEEYFLLYADKELSANEKSMVEMFVQQNPDLEEEFVMLQQSVIKPDTTITLEDKSSLFRKDEFINQDNYEEKFLLYTDNELSLPEIVETEKFVLSNPSLQTEFILLQKVKYEPDASIVFPDKSLLYKKEKAGKVIPFRWKAFAAAVLMGIGLWTGVTYLQKEKTELPVVTTEEIKPKNNLKETIVKQPEQKKEDGNLVTTEEGNKQPLQIIEQKKLDNQVKQQQQDIAVKNIQPVIKQPEVTKQPELKKEDAIIVDVPKKEEPTNNLPKPENTRQPVDKSITVPAVVENTNNAQYASYINDNEVKSENYVFYNITAEEFRKSKVGNFLKKVKRAVERKIPFRGKGLKIGNVEIAKDEQN